MKFIFKEISLFNKKIPVLVIVWFILALAGVLLKLKSASINNYLVFKQVFWHVAEQKNLYLEYPAEYSDINHYGPVFSFLIAPFALLPVWLGCILWCLVNAGVLLLAINKLNISKEKQLIIVAITLIEMMTAVQNVQFNPMIGAWIMLAFILVEKQKDFWATLFIVAGFLTKIYGVAGLLFFVFSRHKLKFILSCIFWMMVLFCLPMLYSSPGYIVGCYRQWFENLVQKNDANAAGYTRAGHQDISVLGMIRRITLSTVAYSSYILMAAAVFILLPLLRFKQYVSENFRLSYLAIVLISVVIFSSSAESSTYVIAVCGAGIWYVTHDTPKNLWVNIILILLFLLTILSPTDLYPGFIKDKFIRGYALKALPCFIIWIWLIAEVSFKNFISISPENSKPIHS